MAKLLIGSKKLGGCKNGTELLCHHGIVGSAPAVDEKVWFFRFLFVTLWYDEVCGNENAIKQCNFENNYGTVA